MALVVQARWNLARARDALPPKLALLETMQRRLQRWIKKAEQLDPGCSSDPQRLLADLKLLVVAPRGLPVSGVITDPFGWRLSTSGRNTGEKHTGVDIGGVMYFKLVRATQDGVVVWAGPMEKYGQAVEIQHEMGFSTLYAHNLSVLVRVGQKVRAGQALAYSGASGHATGPHVHYEVRLNDEPIDPMIFIDLDWPTTRGDRFVR
jgi:murein DD-endopeptidase MepM/ murein hydrolase activator NlpD